MTHWRKVLFARMDKAVWGYSMFEAGRRVLAAVSGGADSMVLLDLLSRRLPVYCRGGQLCAVYVDLGFGDGAQQRCDRMARYFEQIGIPGILIRSEIGPYAHSDKNRENPCFLCSRIRRKKIFEAAQAADCRTIVFGHHKDDMVETLLLNMIFGREISTMPPKLSVFGGRYELVRPLLYMEESLIKDYAGRSGIPVFSQGCPTEGRSKREYIKRMLSGLEADFRGSRENIFQSMMRVKNDYLP